MERSEMVSPTEYRAILAACRQLPPSRSNYHDNDFVSNLIQTVLDYSVLVTGPTAHVVRSMGFFVACRG
jgi:hypothetical protein